jgi:hypothetical protein
MLVFCRGVRYVVQELESLGGPSVLIVGRTIFVCRDKRGRLPLHDLSVALRNVARLKGSS